MQKPTLAAQPGGDHRDSESQQDIRRPAEPHDLIPRPIAGRRRVVDVQAPAETKFRHRHCLGETVCRSERFGLGHTEDRKAYRSNTEKRVEGPVRRHSALTHDVEQKYNGRRHSERG